MSLPEFGKGNGILLINLRKVSDLGEGDNPIKMSAMKPKAQLKVGNESAVRFTHVNPGWNLTVDVMPGSSASSYLSALYVSSPDIEAQWIVNGTGEKVIMSGGVCTDIGEIGRGSGNPSNDQYLFQFFKSIPVLGGK